MGSLVSSKVVIDVLPIEGQTEEDVIPHVHTVPGERATGDEAKEKDGDRHGTNFGSSPGFRGGMQPSTTATAPRVDAWTKSVCVCRRREGVCARHGLTSFTAQHVPPRDSAHLEDELVPVDLEVGGVSWKLPRRLQFLVPVAQLPQNQFVCHALHHYA